MPTHLSGANGWTKLLETTPAWLGTPHWHHADASTRGAEVLRGPALVFKAEWEAHSVLAALASGWGPSLCLGADAALTLGDYGFAQVLTHDVEAADALGFQDAECVDTASGRRTMLHREAVGSPWTLVGVEGCGNSSKTYASVSVEHSVECLQPNFSLAASTDINADTYADDDDTVAAGMPGVCDCDVPLMATAVPDIPSEAQAPTLLCQRLRGVPAALRQILQRQPPGKLVASLGLAVLNTPRACFASGSLALSVAHQGVKAMSKAVVPAVSGRGRGSIDSTTHMEGVAAAGMVSAVRRVASWAQLSVCSC